MVKYATLLLALTMLVSACAGSADGTPSVTAASPEAEAAASGPPEPAPNQVSGDGPAPNDRLSQPPPSPADERGEHMNVEQTISDVAQATLLK